MKGILAGMTSAEIGELLGTSPEAVRQALRYVRQRLKTMLAQTTPPEQLGGSRGEEVR
jgi:DNA-directed RNA polymerase specialized sigma24 family protein